MVRREIKIWVSRGKLVLHIAEILKKAVRLNQPLSVQMVAAYAVKRKLNNGIYNFHYSV
jgi:hypothetical protein